MKCNNSRAQVLFGDRLLVADLRVDPPYGRAFLLPEHSDWLVDMCAPLRIEVLPPHSKQLAQDLPEDRPLAGSRRPT